MLTKRLAHNIYCDLGILQFAKFTIFSLIWFLKRANLLQKPSDRELGIMSFGDVPKS